MATVEAIAAALNLVDVKKENLRKAFEVLQSQCSCLSSFTLAWPDLDSYFTSLQSSLLHKFNLLQTLQLEQPQVTQVLPLPEMKSLCEKMDGLGLRSFVASRREDVAFIIPQLIDALKCAPDAPAMVLDAMDGFYPQSGKDVSVRKHCLVLLEALLMLKTEIKSGVKEKAMKLATEWKGKMDGQFKTPAEELGFLHLVAIYGLLDGFKMDDILDGIAVISRRRQALHLCRVLIIVDKIPDLIQKLISKGNRLLALKFVFEFEMTEKFPPVSFLNAHLEESKEAAEQMRKSGKPLNEAIMKEITALKLVMGCIDEYKLESVYPKNSLVERIEKLKEEQGNRKRVAPPAPAPAPKPQKQSKSQKRNKQKRAHTKRLQHHVRVAGSSGNAIGASQFVAPSAGPGPGPYGWPGAPLPFPTGPTLYPSEQPMLSGSYDHGGYGLPPQYHPSYYPQ